MFPCKYSSGGCTVSLLHTEKVTWLHHLEVLADMCWLGPEINWKCPGGVILPVQVDHEETCEFRPYSCPCPGASCKWQGSLEQVSCTKQFPRSVFGFRVVS